MTVGWHTLVVVTCTFDYDNGRHLLRVTLEIVILVLDDAVVTLSGSLDEVRHWKGVDVSLSTVSGGFTVGWTPWCVGISGENDRRVKENIDF